MCVSFILVCKMVALGRIVPSANYYSLQRNNSPSNQDSVMYPYYEYARK